MSARTEFNTSEKQKQKTKNSCAQLKEKGSKVEAENVGNGQVRDDFVTQAKLFEPHPSDGEVLWKSVHGLMCVCMCVW